MSNAAKVRIVRRGTDVNDVIREIVASKRDDDPFLVFNISELVQKYNEWRANIPKVTPFYAVKCNDSYPVIKVLSSLGCGFDCASKEEIRKVLSQGVLPNRIIYANPAKPVSYLEYARKVGVNLMTYDNERELEKIHQHFPEARLVLRIRADALDAAIQLGTKFGCEPDHACEVIRATAQLGLNLVGFSFHVGTGCKEPGAYPRAIRIALSLVPEAKKYGYEVTLLDIGGGFPGDAPLEFYEAARLINHTLESEKERLKGFKLIAEPGRYFVCTAYKLATTIVGVRQTPSKTIYTVNDSIFGLFNCVWTENIFKIPEQLQKCRQGLLKSSAVWGHTLSPHDRLVDNCLLPELNTGEWIVFDNMGAYSICLQSNFQSSCLPSVHYMITDEAWSIINREKIEFENSTIDTSKNRNK